MQDSIYVALLDHSSDRPLVAVVRRRINDTETQEAICEALSQHFDEEVTVPLLSVDDVLDSGESMDVVVTVGAVEEGCTVVIEILQAWVY